MNILYVQKTAESIAGAVAETAAESVAETLAETQPIALEVQADLQQLKPNVILETIKGWTPGLLSFGYRLLIALIIILIGMRVIKSGRKVLQRTFERMELDLSLSKFLISVLDAIAYALVIFIAADKIGIPSASIIALIGSAGLAIGLSLQGSLANFAGGILILVMRPFVVGNYIICDKAEGTAHDIGLVYTTLMTVDNKKVTIPNGNLSNDTIINVTVQEKRRVDIRVGIGYSSDMKAAKTILESIYRSHPLVLEEDGITVFVDELADSAVMIGGRGWTKTEDYWKAKWDITESIKERFDEAGIEIPFNQLDVNIKKEIEYMR